MSAKLLDYAVNAWVNIITICRVSANKFEIQFFGILLAVMPFLLPLLRRGFPLTFGDIYDPRALQLVDMGLVPQFCPFSWIGTDLYSPNCDRWFKWSAKPFGEPPVSYWFQPFIFSPQLIRRIKASWIFHFNRTQTLVGRRSKVVLKVQDASNWLLQYHIWDQEANVSLRDSWTLRPL